MKLDFRKIKTLPIRTRQNLTFVKDYPDVASRPPKWTHPRFTALCNRIAKAARNDRPVIVSMGGHVIKSCLAPYLIDLMHQGVITHLAMNGSVSIHDFEIALIGATAEDVQDTIEDGRFGMAEETGRMMNEAINGSKEGYGKAIGRMIVEKKMKYRKHSILATAFELGIPATVHVAIGTDIIHQHPICDGAKLGRATFHDFKVYTESVAQMEGGAFLNFGSAVIGPEVFLKALSIARNLGHPVAEITTANFDIRPGIWNYFHRPAKNIVIRPTSLGGQGYNFRIAHEKSIPNLHALVTRALENKD